MTARSFSITVNKTQAPVWSTAANLGNLHGTSTVSIPLIATDPRHLSVSYIADPNNITNGYSLPSGLTLDTVHGKLVGTLANPSNAIQSFTYAIIATNGIANASQTFFGNVVALDTPVWITANGIVANAIELNTCADVLLEMNFEGVNGTTNIIDNQGHNISTFGDIYLSNTTSVIGESSLYCNNGALIVPQNTNEFDLSSADFTIEISVNFSSFNSSNENPFIQQWALQDLGWSFGFVSDGEIGLEFVWSEDGGTSNTISVGNLWAPDLNTWYRLAVIKQGTSIYFFVDGNLILQTSAPTSIFASTAPIVIGFDIVSGNNFNGYIDELRVITGFALYTSNYAPLTLPFISPTVATLQATSMLPLTYQVTNGTLPNGINLIANTGFFVGSFPTVSNTTTYNFDVTATNGYYGNVASFSMIVNVDYPPIWTTAPANLGTVMGGFPFSNSVNAIPVTYPEFHYIVANNTSLPTGLTIDPFAGTISGNPANPPGSNTTYDFVLGAYDGYQTNTQDFSITVNYNIPPVLSISPNTVVGTWFGNVVNTVVITATDPNGLGQQISFSGSLPSGLTISNTGVITGAVPQPATWTANVAATITANNGVSSNTINFFIGEQQFPEPMWNTNSGVLANIVELYSVTATISATDPNNLPISYYVANGILPDGLTLDTTSGVISGIPTENQTGSYVTVTVGANNGIVQNTLNIAFNIQFNGPPVWTTNILPSGFGNVAYTTSLVATDQTGLNQTITYSLGSGTLPGGLSITSNGVIFGTPINSDNTVTSTFGVIASDLGGNATQNFNLTISPYVSPQWTTPSGSLGSIIGGYLYYTVIGATDPESLNLTYSLTNGSLPAGLTLMGTQIAGVPTNPSTNTTSTFAITATDGVGSNTQTFSIEVTANLPPVFTSNGSLLEIYGGATLTSLDNVSVLAIDSNNQTLTYQVDNGTSLPTSLILDPNTGIITGTVDNPTENVVTDFVISAYNGFVYGYQDFSIEVDQSFPPYFPYSGTLGTFASNATVSLSNAIGAIDPQGFAITYSIANSALPANLSMVSNGNITGITANTLVDVTSTFVVEASNLILNNTATFSITVLAVPVPTWVTPSGSLGTVLGGYAFSNTVIANDVGFPLTYTVTTGSLPSGLSLLSNGTITGTTANPNAIQDPISFSVTADDGFNNAVQSFSINVVYNQPPIITTSSGLLANVYGGQFFSTLITAFDPTGFNQSLDYIEVDGSVPAGLNPYSSGAILGTAINPVSNTLSTFTIEVTNGVSSNSANFSIFVIDVVPPVWVTANTLNSVMSFETVNQQLVAEDYNSLPLTYSLTSGTLPANLTLNSNGVISGVVSNTTAYTDSFTVTASDGFSNASQTFMINVMEYIPPTWTTASGIIDTVYSNSIVNVTVVATSPVGIPISYSGSFPGSLSISSTGNITGSPPNTNGTYSFNVTASDGISSVVQNFSIVVIGLLPIWLTSSVPLAYVGVQYSETLLCAGNTPTTFSLASGSLPIGLTLNSSGIISGTPVIASTTVATITAATSAGSTNQTFVFSVTSNTSLYDPYSQYVSIEMPLNSGSGNNASVAFFDVLNHSVNVSYQNNTPIMATPLTYNGSNNRTGVYFNGSASYLSIPVGEEFFFDTNDYTFEWSWFGMQHAVSIALTQNPDGTGNQSFSIQNSNITVAPFNSANSAVVISDITFPSLENAWFDYALVKYGNTITLYCDGNSIATVSNNSVASLASSKYLILGQTTGYLSNLRITNGAARYLSNYVTNVSFPVLPSFVAPENTCIGIVTAGILSNVSILTNDPAGEGLIFTADGLPEGLSINNGFISGTPSSINYTQDSYNDISIMIQDENMNRQMLNYGIIVLAPPQADSFANSVCLLMHFDGTPGSNAINDNLNHNVTSGSLPLPVLTNTTYKFGGSSAYFNGASGITVQPIGNEFAFGSNDFTIELSLMLPVIFTTFNIVQLWQVGQESFNWYYSGGNLIFNWNGTSNFIACPWNPRKATWYQIALVCQSGQVSMYVNGAQIGLTGTISALNASTALFNIGFSNYNSSPFNQLNGYVDELRITNGVARYTSNYTIATTTFANPNSNSVTNTISNSVITWVNQSNIGTFVENTIINIPLVATSSLNKQITYTVVSGSLPSGLNIIGDYITGVVPSPGSYGFTVIAADDISIAANPMAIISTQTISNDPYAGNVVCLMHFDDGTYTDYIGHPVVPVGVSGNPLITIGSNGYYNSCVQFSGSNYLQLFDQYGDLNLGSNDFTIEFAFNPSISVTGSTWVGLLGYCTNNTGFAIYQFSSGIGFYTGAYGFNNHNFSYSFSTGTWYNVAIVRSASTLYVFVNGSQIGSLSISGSVVYNPSQVLTIGYCFGGIDFTGSIDEIRITNGIGRYTSNYIPTSPFPNPPLYNLTTSAPFISNNVALLSNAPAFIDVVGYYSNAINYSLVFGTLPAGFVLDSVIDMTGYATDTTFTQYTFTMSADDSISNAVRTISATVYPATNPIWVTPSGNLGTQVQKTIFNTALSAVANCITLTTSSATILPGNQLNFASTTNVVPGMFIVGPNLQPNTLVEYVTPTQITTSKIIPATTSGTTFNFTPTPVTYSVTSGVLPTGLSLNSVTGVISGYLPNVSSNTTTNFSVTASTVPLMNSTQTFSITTLLSNGTAFGNSISFNVPIGSLGEQAQQTMFGAYVTAQSIYDLPINYFVSSGALPTGLILDNSTAYISGILPTVVSNTTSNFVIGAFDTVSTVLQPFSITTLANAVIDNVANFVVAELNFDMIAGSVIAPETQENTGATYFTPITDLLGHPVEFYINGQPGGEPILSNDVVRNGSGSIYLNNSSSILIGGISTYPEFSIAGQDFTFEVSTYYTSLNNSGATAIISQDNNFQMYYYDGYTYLSSWDWDYTDGVGSSGTVGWIAWTPPINSWSDIALVYSSGTFYLVVDGTEIGTFDGLSTALTLDGIPNEFRIGDNPSANSIDATASVYVDNIRVTIGPVGSGAARYITLPIAEFDETSFDFMQFG